MDPYEGISEELWLGKTKELISNHPLTPHIKDLCLNSWKSVLGGRINNQLNKLIGNMRLSPQATGALLHDVLSEYIEKYVSEGIIQERFRKGDGKNEKDIVCEYDDSLSLEIKTSSQGKIFGNRSYVKSYSGKEKSGYYVAINFEKISRRDDFNSPEILLIKMGWLKHTDWIGQTSEKGQQAALREGIWEKKLVEIYRLKININTADSERLQVLEQVGEKTARMIVEYREAIGGFKKIEDIIGAYRIKESIFEGFRDIIIV